MLRWLVVVVLLLNLAFYAWSQEWLAPLGLAPVEPGEPERLQQQLAPDSMIVKKDIPANQPQMPPDSPAETDAPTPGAGTDATAARP